MEVDAMESFTPLEKLKRGEGRDSGAISEEQ
jgi:hypothetical protein